MFRYDESDPRFLIVYTGDEHPMPADYAGLVVRWVAGLDRNQPFGVIIVAEPHEHPAGEEDDDHRRYEAEVTRIINDFRRDYRERTAQINTGYARVFTPDMVQQGWEANDRFARYNWGIPGGGFTDLDAAKQWLLEQENNQPVPETPAPAVVTGRVGLFFGSSTGITEYIAQEVQSAWTHAGMSPVQAVNITDLKSLALLSDYDCLILGIPTWNIGQLQDDWEIMFPQLDTLDFTGKKIALFGIGDQAGYPDNFLDAVGILGEKLMERGAQLVGYWYDDDYDFRESRAFVNGKFMGLGIDDDTQAHLTGERVDRWVEQIIREFALQPAAAER